MYLIFFIQFDLYTFRFYLIFTQANGYLTTTEKRQAFPQCKTLQAFSMIVFHIVLNAYSVLNLVHTTNTTYILHMHYALCIMYKCICKRAKVVRLQNEAKKEIGKKRKSESKVESNVIPNSRFQSIPEFYDFNFGKSLRNQRKNGTFQATQRNNNCTFFIKFYFISTSDSSPNLFLFFSLYSLNPSRFVAFSLSISFYHFILPRTPEKSTDRIL